MNYSASLGRYHGCEKLSDTLLWKDGNSLSKLASIKHFSKTINTAKKITKITVTMAEKVNNASVYISFNEKKVDEKTFVFAPSALYDGNRFRCVEMPYPPMLTLKDIEDNLPEVSISDVPRLDNSGNSSVALNTGDMATPCIGCFFKNSQTGYLLFFSQGNEIGNFGVTYEEKNGNEMNISLSSPCVREKCKYGMCTTKATSDDRGAQLKNGMELTFSFTEYQFSCKSITEFYDFFFQVRNENGLKQSFPNVVPWSYAFSLIEDKYNNRNWVGSKGFYKSSEATSGICREWQTGWVGGGMNILPLSILGTKLSRDRSEQNLDFIFSDLQHDSGFLYGIFCDGTAYGDNFHNPENINIVMSRKNADALYYLAKLFLYMQKNNISIKISWHEGLKKLADAFCSFYIKNGELGQFIDIENEKSYIGGSSSAGIASAALVLCNIYFQQSSYLEIAKALGEDYFNNYISKGISNGGPGEILSAPDSESAFGLLESYIVLSSFTNDEKWLKYAVDTAALCSSWCVSYDYKYAENTQFYQRGIATTGAVWANVQNKHAAPGICTLSPSSLFRLYRSTSDIKYLSLCRDIAHNITQYVSRADKPMRASYVWHDGNARSEKKLGKIIADTVFTLHNNKAFTKLTSPLYRQLFNPVGRINERVNLSDWEGTNNVGEVPLGSCWCEVSAMLTYLEIPSVYIQSDTGFIYPMDHLECEICSKTEQILSIKLKNPTEYDACYRLFVEKSTDTINPLDDMCLQDFKEVCVKANESVQIQIER